MNKILVFLMVVSSLLFAESNQKKDDSERKMRIEQQIKVEMEKEKKYAREQTFYSQDNYDLKGAEINIESLSHLPNIEVDELDMDSVYD